MPILQYYCRDCKLEFEELVKNGGDEVVCPNCSKKAERMWSGTMYSATGKPQRKCSGKCSQCSGCK